MPIEIKELVIRTVVRQAPSEDDERGGGTPAAMDSGAGNDGVVQECVRQVLRILARNKER
jgi:hypothetical protein